MQMLIFQCSVPFYFGIVAPHTCQEGHNPTRLKNGPLSLNPGTMDWWNAIIAQPIVALGVIGVTYGVWLATSQQFGRCIGLLGMNRNRTHTTLSEQPVLARENGPAQL
jgi:hypothetical protein